MHKKIRIKQILSIVIVVLIGYFAFSPKVLLAQKKKIADNSVCLGCHDDPSITMNRKGKDVSLTVRNYTLARSVHSSLKCQDCHKGFDPDNIPHKEKITPPLCSDCHKDVSNQHLFHPQFKKTNLSLDNLLKPNLNCKGCHGTHDVVSPKSPNSKTNFVNSTNFCGTCHKQQKEQHLQSEHAVEIKKNNPNSPTCLFCHKQPLTNGHGLSQVDKKTAQEKLCIGCHIKNATNEFSKALIDYDKSVHGLAIKKGNKFAATCVDCHGIHDLKKASNPKSSVNSFKIPDICGKCHVSIAQEYRASTHGIALKKGNPDSPGCTFCHGEHAISAKNKVDHKVIADNQMNFNKLQSTKMLECVQCHTDEALMKKYNISTVAKAHEWLPNKVSHWETVRCVDCHSSYEPPNLSHNILPPGKTIKKCEECHSKNSILMSKLYKHEKEKSREKQGFINGTILSDAYVVGTTRNVYLDVLSGGIFAMTLMGLSIHGFLRWYFRKSTHKQNVHTEEPKEDEKDQTT